MDGSVVLEETGGPTRAALSHAQADLDAVHYRIEPTWKNNVNPFFWLKNLFLASGDQFYNNLVAHARAGFNECRGIALAVEANGPMTQAALINNASVESLLKEGALAKNEAKLTTAVAADPRSGVALFNKAIVEAAQSHFDSAILMFAQARGLKLSPEQADEDLDFISQLTTLVTLSRLDTGAQTRAFREMMDAAAICYNAGMPKEAISYAAQAAASDPLRPDPYVLAARICALYGRNQEAIAWSDLAAGHMRTPTEVATITKLRQDLHAIGH
jgi:tetratricopeptide (TPR) repeat protein